MIALLSSCGRSREATQPPAGSATAALAKGQVVDGRFASAALGVDKDYVVYLPAGYDEAAPRRYPVIYMLHGLGGNERSWLEGGHLDGAADTLGLQAIVVMPDGDGSFYVDAVAPIGREDCAARGNPFARQELAADYCVERPDYERYITQDLIAHVDATYRTIAERRGRGIGGLSMGGFGALQLGMRHRDLYAAAASHSGLDSLFYRGPHPYQADQVELLEDVTKWGADVDGFGAYVRGLFGPDPANWEGHDPVALGERLRPGDIALYLDAGTEDQLALNDGAQYLHDRLLGRNIAHQWYLGPGGHDFGFWRQRIDDSLGFFVANLAPAAR